jgi:hypothetical protein
MFKYCLLFIILIVTSLELQAQSRVVSGYLLDSITHFAIINGTVTNGNSKKSVHTNAKGFFRLSASPNDFIYATAKSYHYDTLVYSYLFTDTITIYLSPLGNILPGVTVTTRYNKYQLDSIARKDTFEQDMGKPMKTLSNDHPSGFGLTFNLDKVFKKKYRNRDKAERNFSLREKMAYVDYRFSPHIVAYYTGLKGDALRSFLNKYTPDYDWLRQHPSNEDVMFYINDKLKLYHASMKR